MKDNKEIIRTIKFTLFSASAGIIEFGSFFLMDRFLSAWPYWIKYLIALILSVLWNFTLNRRFTFQSANNVPVAMFKVACYYAVFTPASTLFGNCLVETLKWNGLLVTIINMLANFVTEYFLTAFSCSETRSIRTILRKKEGRAGRMKALEGVSF